MDDLLQKWQADSLTFWPKYGVLGHFIICGGKLRKLKIDDFFQKWQANNLTFSPKYGVFGHFIICARK